MPDLAIVEVESDVELKLRSTAEVEGIGTVRILMRPSENFVGRLGFWERATRNLRADCTQITNLMPGSPAAKFCNNSIKIPTIHSGFLISLRPNPHISRNALDPVWHSQFFTPLKKRALFIVLLSIEQ